MRLLLFVLIFNTFFSCFSQVPGYMGKKFVAGYGFYYSPYFFGPENEVSANTIHEGFVDYALRKRISLGASVRYFHSISENRCYASGHVSTTNNYVTNEYQIPTGQISVNGLNYCLYFKFFQNNYSAPWGRYFILGPIMYTYNATYNPNEMYIYEEPKNYNGNISEMKKVSDFGSTKQAFIGGDVMIGFGRCRVIANRITLDYGCNANILAVTTTLFDVAPNENLDILSPANIPIGDYIKRTATSRVRGVNRFNVFLKVGVLLF